MTTNTGWTPKEANETKQNESIYDALVDRLGVWEANKYVANHTVDECRNHLRELKEAESTRDKSPNPRITTQDLSQTPTYREMVQAAHMQELNDPRTDEERALDEWQADAKDTEFGTREWFNSLPEIPF